MWKMIAAAGLLGVTLAFAGCGDDNDSKYDKKTTDVPATVTGQSATVTTATPVVTKDDQTVLTLPVGAVLTATAGTMPQQLSILIRTPDNGRTSGVPSKAGFELDDAAGAVDVSIPGVTAFTVTPGVNVVIPVETQPAWLKAHRFRLPASRRMAPHPSLPAPIPQQTKPLQWPM